ncbi:MAG: cell division protein FtsQ/DivIB [Zetaproteobacteria bacterium]|nr:cell division protein FtsQ/DivIB [Zetaproteobacteria bacterium]
MKGFCRDKPPRPQCSRSVLAQQKIISKRRCFGNLWMKPIIRVLPLLLLGLWAGWSYKSWSWFWLQPVEGEEWQVEVVGAAHGKDKHKLQASLTEYFNQEGFSLFLRADWHQHLQQGFLAESDLAYFEVMRTGLTRVAVRGVAHIPLMQVDMQGWRYVSSKGVIYGKVSGSESLPRLRGLFDVPSRQANVINAVEKTRLRQSLKLYRLCQHHKLSISDIGYQRYRGFSLKLAGHRTEVLLGFESLERKLERLLRLLEERAPHEPYPERIELDYLDKAYIIEST